MRRAADAILEAAFAPEIAGAVGEPGEVGDAAVTETEHRAGGVPADGERAEIFERVGSDESDGENARGARHRAVAAGGSRRGDAVTETILRGDRAVALQVGEGCN